MKHTAPEPKKITPNLSLPLNKFTHKTVLALDSLKTNILKFVTVRWCMVGGAIGANIFHKTDKRHRAVTSDSQPQISFALGAFLLVFGTDGQASDCPSGSVSVQVDEQVSRQEISEDLCHYTITSEGEIKGTLTTQPIDSAGEYGLRILTDTAINSLDNAGSITAEENGRGVDSSGTITTFNNIGEISVGTGGRGIQNFGTINSLDNSGSITAGENGRGVENSFTSTIITLNNTSTGEISAEDNGSGVFNRGTISTLGNFGTITTGENGEGIVNLKSLTTLDNSGTISAGINGYGVTNDPSGTITTFNNIGEISVGTLGSGVLNFGIITTLDNSGSITAGENGRGVESIGTITTFNNIGEISVGTGGSGVLNVGTIITLNNTSTGEISAGDNGSGVFNLGTISTLDNSGSITAGENGRGVDNSDTSTITTFNNIGEISVGTSGSGVFNFGIITTLDNSGSITAEENGRGVDSSGTITTFNNIGEISVGTGGSGVLNFGIITTLDNSGSITAGENGRGVVSIGTITTFNNIGEISVGTGGRGIQNFGTISALDNSGSITASEYGRGINNIGSISTLDNFATITAGVEGVGVANFGTITTLNNSDTISVEVDGYGIYNHITSTITTLSNIGKISVGTGGRGIQNFGTISALDNSGSITASEYGRGINNIGSISALDNSGSITAGEYGRGINNFGSISTLDNFATITAGVEGAGVANFGTITTLNNSDTISVEVDGYGIYNHITSTITTLSNIGEISVGTSGGGIRNFGTISALDNSGSITASEYGRGINNFGTITTLGNFGTITTGEDGEGIVNLKSLTTLDNSGTISAGINGNGVTNDNSGTITTLSNSGTIMGGNFGAGVYTNATSIITTLSNTGTISAGIGGYGIRNDATISTLNNSQGKMDGALVYRGTLPENYNIIINSPIDYGQVSFIDPTGSLIFSVDDTSTVANGTYSSVFEGLSSSNISSTSGIFGSKIWSLVNASGTIWDLTLADSTATSLAPGMTYTLAEVNAGNVIPVFDGGKVTTASGDKSSIAFTINAGGGTITAPSSDSVTLSGVISGVGGMTFDGAGTTILTGANTYSGGTTVSSGKLSIAGSSATGNGNVAIMPGAFLMGSGTIAGRVDVAGTLKPGNSPGYLAATSTVKMNAGSKYLQDIAGTVQASSETPVGESGYFSFLNVTGGQFIIQPGALLAPQLSNLFATSQPGFGSEIFVPSLGDRFRMVTADGGIVGKFSSVAQPAELATGTQLFPFYNMNASNSIDLAVIPTSYQSTIAAASGTANAQSVGGVLNQIALASSAGTSTATQDQLLYAISGQTTAQRIAKFGQSLAGEVYAANIAITAQTTQRTQQTVLNRLGNSAGFGSTTPNLNAKPDQTILSNGNVWGNLAYQRGNRSSDDQSGGWNSNLFQLTFGSDLYSSQGTTFGAGFAISSTTLNPDYGSSTVQQGSLFAYGKLPVDAFVLDAMANIGISSSDIYRTDVTALSTGFENKSVSGNDALISLGLSRAFETGKMNITPYGRLTWQRVTQSSVNEGNAASALSVNRFTGNGVRGVIGLAASSKTNNQMAAKYTYRAYVGLGADSSELLNPTVTASLAGINTNITTPTAGRMFVQVGLYGTAKISDNAFAFAGISGEARSGQTLGAVNVGLKVQF